MLERYTVALAGNPNCGKSTIFNALTGAHQHVGNWPGKTVERKEGQCVIEGAEITLVDLPGAYSLSAYSLEETIAMDYLIDARPSVVIAVVDAANLERNLYLVVQILEMGLPVILALNMADVVELRGLKIDRELISQGLGHIPVIPTVATHNRGLDDLRAAILAVARQSAPHMEAQPT